MSRARARYELDADDKSAGAFRSFKRSIGDATKALGGLAGIAGGIGVAGLASFVKGAIDAGDEVQKLAIQTGLSTEFLSEMRHVAGLSGAQFSSLEIGAKRFGRAIDEAVNGRGGKAAETFQRLGLDAKALLALPLEERMLRAGEALRGVADDSTRAALGAVLFGGASDDLLRITQNGSAAIAAMRAEARELGLSLSRDQVDQMAAANDAMARLGAAAQGLGVALAVEFAGPITQAADTLKTALVPALRIVGGLFTTIGTAIGGFAAAIGAALGGEFREAARIAIQTRNDLVESLLQPILGDRRLAERLRGRPGPGAGAGPAPLERQVLEGAFGPTGELKANVGQLDETNRLLRTLVDKPAVAVAG